MLVIVADSVRSVYATYIRCVRRRPAQSKARSSKGRSGLVLVEVGSKFEMRVLLSLTAVALCVAGASAGALRKF